MVMTMYAATIVADSLEAATRLRALGLDLHERAARRRPDSGEIAVPALLTDEQIERVRAAGYRVEVEQDMDRAAVERAAEVDTSVNRLAPYARSDERADAREARSDDAGPLGTLESLMDPADLVTPDEGGAVRSVLGGYLTPDELASALTTLAAAHPAVATVTVLPERSWEQRSIHLLRLRAGPRQDRGGVLVTGGMHAREWGGSDICVAFATNLLRAYAAGTPLVYGGKRFSAPQVKAILERLDLFVLANVNPDGKQFSQLNDPTTGGAQGTWWRKNRNPNPGLAARGVDLNRNFDFLWSSGIGTSTDPTSFTYKGRGAFSEPEARNIRHVLDTHKHIAYFVDVHSFGELILYPWGDDENQGTNTAQTFLNPAFATVRGVVGDTAYKEFMPAADQTALRQLARGMNTAMSAVRGRSYTVQQAVGLYPTSGTSDDYLFSRHRADPARGKVYGFTIEFGREFVPPYPEMRRIIADVAAALTELCRRVATA